MTMQYTPNQSYACYSHHRNFYILVFFVYSSDSKIRWTFQPIRVKFLDFCKVLNHIIKQEIHSYNNFQLPSTHIEHTALARFSIVHGTGFTQCAEFNSIPFFFLRSHIHLRFPTNSRRCYYCPFEREHRWLHAENGVLSYRKSEQAQRNFKKKRHGRDVFAHICHFMDFTQFEAQTEWT